MLIRREVPGDERAIRDVHADSFASHYPGGHPVEPALVDALRGGEAWIPPLSLVAEVDGAIAGHVCCTRATLLPGGQAVLGLGPLGVRTAFRCRGVGRALMHAVLAAADALDELLVVLLGHRAYYPRFGFVLAADLGVEPEVPQWAGDLQARPLTRYRPGLTGRFRYAKPFYDL